MKKHLFLLTALSLSCILACNKPDNGSNPKLEELVVHKDKEVKLTSSSFKLMSFNVRYKNTDDDKAGHGWEKRSKGVYEMLSVQKPLVMGVQECLWTQRYGILMNTKGYETVGVGRNDGAESGEAMLIFYQKDSIEVLKSGTFWLSATPDVPGVKGWDAACVRTCTWARLKHKRIGKEFFYFNTHLDHKGKVARSEEMKLIQKKMSELNTDGLPCVFTADFNTDENDVIFDDIKKVMRSARVEAPVSDNHASYNGFGNSSGKIDHIWYSGFDVAEFKTVSSSYAGVSYISDHNPIYAIFSFK